MIVLVETTLCLLKTLNLCLNLQITWIHRASGNVVFVVVVVYIDLGPGNTYMACGPGYIHGCVCYSPLSGLPR